MPGVDTTWSILPNFHIRLYSFSRVMTIEDAQVMTMTNRITFSANLMIFFICSTSLVLSICCNGTYGSITGKGFNGMYGLQVAVGSINDNFFAEEEVINRLEQNLQKIASVTTMLDEGNTTEKCRNWFWRGSSRK